MPVGSSWAVISPAPPPGYASTVARRSEILGVQKDQSTWHRGFFTPFAYKASHIVLKEESGRPSLRQDSLWQGESDCEQLTDSTEMARDSLRTFDGLK